MSKTVKPAALRMGAWAKTFAYNTTLHAYVITHYNSSDNGLSLKIENS